MIDPARPDFVRHWVRIAGCGAVAALAAAAMAVVVVLQTPFGRFMRAVVDVEYLHRNAEAESAMRDLIAEGQGERFAVYAALASALEAQGRPEEALDVLDEAVTRFPVDYRAHAKRCRLGIEIEREASVLPSCVRAVELDADNDRNLERRAAALAASGDLPGSRADVQALVQRCRTNRPGDSSRRCERYREWLASLESGENPFVDGVRIR